MQPKSQVVAASRTHTCQSAIKIVRIAFVSPRLTAVYWLLYRENEENDLKESALFGRKSGF